MNGWIAASGILAAASAAGHAIAGRTMFLQPIRTRLADPVHDSVVLGMWHFITAQFALSSLALLACAYGNRTDLAVGLIAAQFAAYAAINLILSLRLGNVVKFAQWILFTAVAVLAALGLILG